MGNYLINGIVLENRTVDEKDVLVTVFSLERGKIRFKVRGTKKPESSLRGSVETLTEGRFYVAERRGWDILTEWEPVDYNLKLKKDLRKLSYASYLVKFLGEAAPAHSRDHGLFYFVKNIIILLQFNIEHDIIKPLIEWGFLSNSGLAPEFGVCAECGGAPGARGAYWNIAEGELYCSGCREAGLYNCAGLSLEAVEFGKKIISSVEALTGGILVGGDLAGRFSDELSGYARRYNSGTAEFSISVTRFCEYHLRDDIGRWLVSLD